MTKISRREFGLLSGAGLMAAALSPSALLAQTKGVEHRLNVAARQRMLSQRIAMAAFLVGAEVDVQDQLEILASSHGEFAAALTGMREGSPDLEIDAETDESVLAILGNVEKVWPAFSEAIASVAISGKLSRKALNAVAKDNVALLTLSNFVVIKMIEVYGDVIGRNQNATQAMIIDIAGRQRMLTQKMTKEAALLALGYKKSDSRRALEGTVELFDETLFALLKGDDSRGIPPAPQTIAEKLLEIEDAWLGTGEILKDVAREGRVDQYDLSAIEAGCETLLIKSNEVVTLYEIG